MVQMRKRDIAAGFEDGKRIGAGGVQGYLGGKQDFRYKVDSIQKLKNAGLDIIEINDDEGVANAIKNMAKKKKKHQFLDLENEEDAEALQEEIRECEENEGDLDLGHFVESDDEDEEERERINYADRNDGVDRSAILKIDKMAAERRRDKTDRKRQAKRSAKESKKRAKEKKEKEKKEKKRKKAKMKRKSGGDDSDFESLASASSSSESEWESELALTDGVVVHHLLAKHLKKHQVEGVEFMWRRLFPKEEPQDKIEGKDNPDRGYGSLLAHHMGLGKTLQVISVIHTAMKSPGIAKGKKVRACQERRTRLM